MEVARSGELGMCFRDDTIGFISKLNIECEREM